MRREKTFDVGEFVKMSTWNNLEHPQPYGIVVHYDNFYYIVKWFDSPQEDGGYTWASIEKI
jgi:hypothetical protein